MDSPGVSIDPSTASYWQSAVFVRTAIALIGCVPAIFYLNSFNCAFVFDDNPHIIDNPSIRQLWPPGEALFHGLNISRPLVGYSLALNYWISGLSPWSYHVLNLTVHIGAALALFGLVRRTLRSPMLASRYENLAAPIALAIALLWAVHPLQTQAVTYVIQRCESMMGMWYLLTIYFAVRSFAAKGRASWVFVAAVSCAAGMLTKQTMVTAPIMVLVFDVLFFSRSIRLALRKHWPLYTGLAVAWGVLAATIVAAPTSESAGFAVRSISPLQYLISEFSVICHYVRLSFFPAPLVFDYAWPRAASLWTALPYALPVLLAGCLSAYGLWQRAPAAIFGVWFLLILAVTCSIMPIADLAFEYRMYLPLAGVIAACVFASVELWRRLPKDLSVGSGRAAVNGASLAVASVVIVVSVLGIMTFARNQDYKSEIGLWADTVVKQPENARARTNFGSELRKQGRLQEALAQYVEGAAANPSYALAFYNCGTAYSDLGHYDEAERYLTEALRLDSSSYDAHNNLGRILANRGEYAAAEGHFLKAIELQPGFAAAMTNLAAAYVAEGKSDQARATAEEAVRIQPSLSEAQYILAVACESLGDARLAEHHLLQAIQSKPNYAGARLRLARLLVKGGRNADAAAQYRQLLELSPRVEEAWMELGRLLESEGRAEEAANTYREALQSIPDLKSASEALRIAGQPPRLMIRSAAR